MSNDFKDLDQARQIFLRMVIARAYEGAIRSITAYLQRDWPGKKVPMDIVDLQDWFETLDDKDRQRVQTVIRKSVDAAVFGFLVLLDGMTGGNPLQDKPSDFALYLQAYESDELLWDGVAEARIRLNNLRNTEDLHDLYRNILEENSE